MLRPIVIASLLAATGVFAFAAGAGLTGSYTGAALIAAGAAAGVLGWIRSHPPLILERRPPFRGLEILAAVAALAALLQIACLAVFMVDSSKRSWSSIPSSTWEVEHSCLSAYYIAANASPIATNIYDEGLYSLSKEAADGSRTPRKIGIFNVDVFEYPPPFLLLPRALISLAPEFLSLRALWFALNGGLLLLAIWMVAQFMGPQAGRRALLLSPLVWLGLPTMSALQKGNVQVLVIAASMLAMILFERGYYAGGGALLAFLIAGKLFPGLLVIYLLGRKETRAVIWTAGFGLAYVLLTFILLGWPPYAAFLNHLPGLLSGEAFMALRRDSGSAINLSIPGLVFKLKLLGFDGLGIGASKAVGWIFNLIAAGAALVAGLRVTPAERKPQVWLAILILATLRSPFLPQAYGAFPALWLMTLVAANSLPGRGLIALVIATWAALNIYWPTDWRIDSRLLAMANGLPQLVMVLLVMLAMKRPARPPDPRLPAPGPEARVPQDVEALMTLK